MRTLLICHSDEPLSKVVMSRWLNSFSTLAGVVVIEETKGTLKKRIKRTLKRVGFLRFLDVLAFQVYYRIFLQNRDREWEQTLLSELSNKYPEVDDSVPWLVTANPNSAETKEFIKDGKPDIVIARCKILLSSKIFTIPVDGTFVMHPGICPEYRNSHGCFWALANDDRDRVGMTLLKIDAGVDTGPVYGYFKPIYDEAVDSHIVIQNKTVFDNLPEIARTLTQIHEGTISPIDTTGRKSAAWGQPWLTAYIKWKSNPKK